MARFSALTLLVTLFYFFVWATQVSTPLHSDMSLRTITIVPQPCPVLTISAPPPTRSPCAGINRCDKTPIYGTWASRIVRSVNQARGYLNVRDTIRPYLLQVDRYVHQVTEILGRPTPDSSVGLALMPTTGKATSPLIWARAEKAPAARPTPPPPPPPTRSLPVYFPPTPTSGPWNPPTPTSGHSRPRHAEPTVEVDSDDWFQQAVFIGSTLIVVTMCFVWRFVMALSSVECVEHRNSESDGAVAYCGAICSVVPPPTEPSASQVTPKPIIKTVVETQQSRAESPLVAPPTARPEPTVSETTNQMLDVVVWRSSTLIPTPVVPLTPAPFFGILALASGSQLGVVSRQLLRPDDVFNHVGQTHSLIVTKERRVPLLIEWHATTIEEMFQIIPSPTVAPFSTSIPTIPYPRTFTILNHTFDFPTRSPSEELRHSKHRPIFERRAPPSIEWCPIRKDVSRRAETPHPPRLSDTVSTPSLALVSCILKTVFPTPALLHLIPWLPFEIVSHEALRPVIFQHPCARNVSLVDQGVAIRRRAPLLIEWRPKHKVEVILPSARTVFGPTLPISESTTDHLFTPPKTRLSIHLLRALNAPSYTHTTYVPSFDSKINCSSARLLIEWHSPPQVTELPDDEAKVDPEPLKPSVATSTPAIHSNPPPPPKAKAQAPLHIPLSFHRYGNIRLEDLDKYPPDERQRVLSQEIRLAEARYQDAKLRRDRARANTRLARSEMERKGKRLPKRRKSEEEIEEEEEMKKVMRARRRGEEEVFEGRGGPPPPVPKWLQDWFDMITRDCGTYSGKKKGKGKGKKVRWADEAGMSLVAEREIEGRCR